MLVLQCVYSVVAVIKDLDQFEVYNPNQKILKWKQRQNNKIN